MYAATIAIAPIATLITPEPRYTRTTPSAMLAIRAPAPSPSTAKRMLSRIGQSSLRRRRAGQLQPADSRCVLYFTPAA